MKDAAPTCESWTLARSVDKFKNERRTGAFSSTMAFISFGVVLKMKLASATRWGSVESGKGGEDEMSFRECLCQEIIWIEGQVMQFQIDDGHNWWWWLKFMNSLGCHLWPCPLPIWICIPTSCPPTQTVSQHKQPLQPTLPFFLSLPSFLSILTHLVILANFNLSIYFFTTDESHYTDWKLLFSFIFKSIDAPHQSLGLCQVGAAPFSPTYKFILLPCKFD